MKVRLRSLLVLLGILFVTSLVSCTKGVVPGFSVLNNSINSFPFVDGGAQDGSFPYLQNFSKTPSVVTANNALYLVSSSSGFGGIHTYIYNGNDSLPMWNDYGFFSPQSSPGIAGPASLSSNGAAMYSAWVETNTSGYPGVTQVHAALMNGTAWNSINGPISCGSANCINISPAQNATSPTIVSHGSALNLFWSEAVPATSYTQIKGVHSTDSGLTWPADTPSALNIVPTNSAFTPHAVLLGTQVFVTWVEYATANAAPAQLHVDYSSDGLTFTNIDGANLPTTGMSGTVGNGTGAATPFLAANNGKIYLTWIGSFTGSVNNVRVAVFNGSTVSPAWTFVDGGGSTGLNSNSTLNASAPRMATGANGQLYLTWAEANSFGVTQTRVAAYNGNDLAPAWNFVDGGGNSGINFNTNINASWPSLILFNGKMYSTWEENNSGGGQDLSRVRYLF